jgi:hypothetical protein
MITQLRNSSIGLTASCVDFAEFLENHWKDAYSALFIFHIQPFNPLLSCAIINMITDTKGTGNENIVASLLDLKDILEFCYDFDSYTLESSATISSILCWGCPLGNHEASLIQPLIPERMET